MAFLRPVHVSTGLTFSLGIVPNIQLMDLALPLRKPTLQSNNPFLAQPPSLSTRRNREALITDRDDPILDVGTVPTGELLDLRDPHTTPKRFPDVCGSQPPATFQFLPATGALGFILGFSGRVYYRAWGARADTVPSCLSQLL